MRRRRHYRRVEHRCRRRGRGRRRRLGRLDDGRRVGRDCRRRGGGRGRRRRRLDRGQLVRRRCRWRGLRGRRGDRRSVRYLSMRRLWRSRLLGGAAAPTARLQAREQLQSFRPAKGGVVLGVPQHAAAVGGRGIAPVANLAGDTLRVIGAAQLDPALEAATPASKLHGARRARRARHNDDKHRERPRPEFLGHEIGT